jgi:hypothetical protein
LPLYGDMRLTSLRLLLSCSPDSFEQLDVEVTKWPQETSHGYGKAGELRPIMRRAKCEDCLCALEDFEGPFNFGTRSNEHRLVRSQPTFGEVQQTNIVRQSVTYPFNNQAA